jgi:hypothetical protein
MGRRATNRQRRRATTIEIVPRFRLLPGVVDRYESHVSAVGVVAARVIEIVKVERPEPADVVRGSDQARGVGDEGGILELGRSDERIVSRKNKETTVWKSPPEKFDLVMR